MDRRPSTPRYRPLLLPAAEFALGIALRELLGGPPLAFWTTWLSVVAAGGFALAWRRGRISLALVHIACLLTGWCRLDLHLAGSRAGDLAPVLAPGQSAFVRLRGTIVSEPRTEILPPRELSGGSSWLASEEHRIRFRLSATEILTTAGWRRTRASIHVVVHGDRPRPRYGDAVEATGRLARPGPRRNPVTFDPAALMRRRGIDLVLSLQPSGLRVIRRGRVSLVRLLTTVKGFVRERLEERLDRNAATMLKALLLGEREGLKRALASENPQATTVGRSAAGEELSEAFKRTGTMHLLAISGFHVGVVAWVVWRLTALAGAGRRPAGVLTLAASWLYIILAGAPPSAVRAGAMLSAYLLGVVGKRQFDLPQSIAAAALVILAVSPYQLFNVGFQLSFLAVLSIVCLTEDFYALLRPRERLIDRLLGPEGRTFWRRARRWLHSRAAILVAVSTAAWLGVFPLTAYYFNLVSPVGILMNLVGVPLVALLVVLGWVHLAVGWIPVVGGITARLADGIGCLLAQSVSLVADGRVGWTYCTTPSPIWIVAYYLLGLVIVGRARLGISGKRAAALWFAAIALYLGLTLSPKSPDGLELTVLDVGHGSANVLRFPDGHVALFDCGSYGRDDVGRWVVAPALWAKGVRKIDLMVVSHADADHINGIPALLQRFPVGRVVHSPVVEDSEAGRQLVAMLDRHRVPHESARAGDRIRIGHHTIEILAPTDWTLENLGRNQNENSLVARLEHRGKRILLTGDLQDAGATILLRSGQDIRADVLVVPHHGHKMARTEEFARAVAPSLALVSNRIDHLPQETVAAYRACGARVLSTGDHGAIALTIRNGQLEAKPLLTARCSGI